MAELARWPKVDASTGLSRRGSSEGRVPPLHGRRETRVPMRTAQRVLTRRRRSKPEGAGAGGPGRCPVLKKSGAALAAAADSPDRRASQRTRRWGAGRVSGSRRTWRLSEERPVTGLRPRAWRRLSECRSVVREPVAGGVLCRCRRRPS
eukprot:223759-Rhodomonas_salina.1